MKRSTRKTTPVPADLWYVPDRRIRTKQAAERAEAIAKRITTVAGSNDPMDTNELFIAMHVCAFRAARPERGRRIPEAERQRWARRWETIRDHIVERNLGLAFTLIPRFTRSTSMDEDEATSEALYGLARAVERFNPWKGFRFSTYACNVIARALMRRQQRESRYRRLFPIQHEVKYDPPSAPPDATADLRMERLRKALAGNLGDLTALESDILARRFPAERDRRMTFREIGEAVDLSKERVRQIQNMALRKLRDVLKDDPLLR